jgi:hypothetical protein
MLHCMSKSGPQGTTCADLLRLWEWAAETGHMNARTANQYRTACARVLENWAPDYRRLDVRDLDIDKVIKKFRAGSRTVLTTGTLDTYGSVFERAVPSLVEYMADPAAWQPPTKFTKRLTQSIPSTPSTERARGSSFAPPTDIEITLPSGGKAHLALPSDATADDIRFLVSVLPAYIPPGDR